MADIIRARQGDTIDALLWRERSLDVAALPAVLAANPGLAGLGAILPVDTPVVVPEAATAAATRTDTVQIWD